ARLNMKRIIDYAAPWSILEIVLTADMRLYPGKFFVMIDKLGQVLSYDNFAYFFISSPGDMDYIQSIVRPVNRNVNWAIGKFRDSLAHHACIALATLQFMNLKNVEIIHHGPSRQQRRKAQREGKDPSKLTTYKTLVIHPIGKRHVYDK